MKNELYSIIHTIYDDLYQAIFFVDVILDIVTFNNKNIYLIY